MEAESNDVATPKAYPAVQQISHTKERDFIQSTLNDMSNQSRGQLFVLKGDSGIGKSYLAQQVISWAEQHQLTCYHSQFFYPNPYQQNGIRDLLLAIFGWSSKDNWQTEIELQFNQFNVDPNKHALYLACFYHLLAEPIPHDLLDIFSSAKYASRQYIEQALITLVITQATRQGKTLIVLQDIHHLPNWQHRHIKTLLSLVNTLPLVVLCTMTPGTIENTLLNSHLPLITMSLTPFSQHELSTAFPQTQQIQQTNTLLRHWANKLEDGNPSASLNLADILKQLIEQLTEADRLALYIASILGMRFDAKTLSALVGIPHYHAHHLINHGFIKAQQNTLQFSHANIQNTVYQLIPVELKQQLHQSIAVYYQEKNTLYYAQQLINTGKLGAGNAFLAAAISYRDRYDIEIAAQLFDQAVKYTQSTPQSYFALMLKGEMLLAAELHPRAIQAFEQALQVTQTPQEQALTHFQMAIGLIGHQQYDVANNLLTNCQTSLEATQDHLLLCQFYYYNALTLSHQKQTHFAHQHFKIALEHAKQIGSDYWQATIQQAIGMRHLATLELTDAQQHLEQSTQYLSQATPLGVAMPGQLSIAKIKLLQLQFHEAINDIQTTIDFATTLQDHTILKESMYLLSLHSLLKGQYKKLLHHTELASELCRIDHDSAQLNTITGLQLVALYYAEEHSTLKKLSTQIQQQNSASYKTSPTLCASLALASADSEFAELLFVSAAKQYDKLTDIDVLVYSLIGIEAAIKHQLWEVAESIADKLITQVNNEPNFLFIICAERVRILANLALGLQQQNLHAELVDLYEKTKQYGLVFHLPSYEAALAISKIDQELA